jgi:uncharacterized membrane protein (DUF2068 family)
VKSASQPNHHLGLRSVAIYEFTKGFLVLLVGLGLLSLVHKDVQANAENILHTFHLDPAWHYSKLFIEKSATLTDTRLRLLSILALSYSALRFVIVFGLWRERVWAEWVTAISAGIYIPLEIIHLVEKPGLTSVIVPVINVAIVIYLAWLLADRHRQRKARAGNPTPRTPDA